jgi:hypothetical protein
MATQTELTADEIGDRGETIYEERLRAQLEPGNVGRFLSIDIDSGEYEMGDNRLENVHRLRGRLPNAVVYTLKIGYPAVAVIGDRLRPNSETARMKKPQ